MEFKDYYATLGVGKTATQKEIKQAFRKLARKYHPDVNPGDANAERMFKELNEAHEVLSDPAKRAKYDELGANWRQYENQPPGGAPGGAWSSSSGGFRTMTPEEMRDLFGDEDPFSDFFKQFFGGGVSGGTGRRARTPRARRGQDVEADLDLTLEEAFQGTSRRLQMQGPGAAPPVEVRIPRGVGDGSRVRVSGKGAPGVGSAPPGDLFINVRLVPHPRFERRGDDLHARVPIPVTTAVLGGSLDVPSISGGTLRLKIPPGTQNMQVFRLKGHGMPQPGKPDVRGDLYVTTEAELPRQVSARQRELYEEIAKLESTTS